MTRHLEFPKKANLGCGYDIRENYLNIDLHERHGPDLVADITKLDVLPNDWFDEIVAQDVLEHVERHKVAVALKEWARILAPNGVIQVRVPSLELIFKMLSQPQNRPANEAAKIIHLLYGTQEYTGDYHLAGFTAAVLEQHLNDVGLQICKAEISYGWCFDVHARKTDVLDDVTEFAYSAYFKILGRPADADGINHFTHAIKSGFSRDQLLKELQESREGRAFWTGPSYLLDHLDTVQPIASASRVADTRPTVRGALSDLRSAIFG